MIVSTARQTDRQDLLHEVPVEGVRVVEVEHAALRPGDLLLAQLPVEGVLGQGHHLQHPAAGIMVLGHIYYYLPPSARHRCTGSGPALA